MRQPIYRLAFAGFAFACSPGGPPPILVGPVEVIGPAGSGEPHLAAMSDGSALMTWLEKSGERSHALKVAVRGNGSWSEPRTVVEGQSLLANWADFPSILPVSDHAWLVHWLEKTGGGHSYGIRLSVSRDSGSTWSAPLIPHRDSTLGEHGFVSAVALGKGAAMIWLDGRALAVEGDSTRAMQLRFTRFEDDRVGEEVLLDARTCECCQTALARTTSGLVAAYRDRTEGEIRDIAVIREIGGSWTEPVVAFADGWHYKGCPVNGPQLSALGDTVALAWYAAPDTQPRVQMMFSFDAGATWGAPVRIDDGRPTGRVDVELIDGETAVVSWIESTGSDAEVRARSVTRDGRKSSAAIVSATSAARSSGFPRMARVGGEILFAWTAPGDSGGVRVAAARVAGR